MKKNRLEAFTDAIVPIIMTVLVLELSGPKTYSWQGLWDMREELMSYAISFFLLAVVWGNHHHMFLLVKTIDGFVIWSNTLLLFFLSFVPFATAIVDADHQSLFSSQLYTLLFIAINLSWNLLRISLVRANKSVAVLVRTLKRDPKSIYTLFAFIAVFLVSFYWHQFGMIGTFIVMLLWVMPYRKIEEAAKRL
ncbi:TMEM175 family protein [Lentilactobacillus parabuchneri]|uniref:TMEM175 family protein n=1 Tax=Lentilactobacillus parabuchneri TaxID=152331 RepID=UPI0031D7A94C